ncbi:MAG: Rrf2 family transcriptional regulator [Phycisphaerae bacterium]|nr:Rrf2 family transcriptional regulator [Phycisphaerae bacterium]
MTKKTGYGLIAMIHLARLPEKKLASAREISDAYGISLSLMMNVLKKLCAAGYVESVRGSRGGYRMLRPAEEINFVGLMEALEGPMKLAECITRQVEGLGSEMACKLISQCPIANPIHRVNSRIREVLSGVTLAEIIEDTAGSRLQSKSQTQKA